MYPGESLIWTFPGDWHWVSVALVNVHPCAVVDESANATGAAAIDIATAPAANSGAIKRRFLTMVELLFRN
jgi:hypothetical protein